MSDYVVAVKPSARRTNGAVGRLVNRKGPRHAFPRRPADSSDADAYLVGRYGRHALDGPREAADVEATEGLGTFADDRGDDAER